METCTIETGMLRKKPCGGAAVAHCLNCEQALCSQHAVAQKGETGSHTGKFLCKECEAAWKEQVKNIPAPPPKGAAAPKPAFAPKPEPKKEEAPAPKPAESGAIEFTPTKKP
jgi:hypothetical protein